MRRSPKLPEGGGQPNASRKLWGIGPAQNRIPKGKISGQLGHEVFSDRTIPGNALVGKTQPKLGARNRILA